MHAASALTVSLSLTKTPSLSRAMRNAPLPNGMTELLQIAAGDAEAIQDACRITGRSEQILRKAAGFFVEQILFARDADSYRVLGAVACAETNELRKHMALLVKWLHPDVAATAADGLDRSVFANRVTGAWQDIKSPERRAAYDRALSEHYRSRQFVSSNNPRVQPKRGATTRSHPRPKLRVRQVPRHLHNRETPRNSASFINLLVRFMRGRE